MDLNKVMIIGRLTRDPELRTTPSGSSVCQIGLATNFVYNNQTTGQKVEQVEYHNVVLWRKLGEIAAQYLKKGRRVYIEGRLQTRSWDGKDGQKKSRTEIVGENMIMLDGGGATGAPYAPAASSAPSQNFSAPAQSSQQAPVINEELPTIVQGEDINVEDIPF
ncbi:MAG: single-stranded DNA-binding protein [Candidatus Doudnabacteria bacterium]|nr:single-stranded DNA-binding protein [Candidatus Doudnabacteria bacterium]